MPQETWRQGRPQRCLTKSHTSRPERFKLGATLYENGPVTEIEVFKFAEAVVIEVQLPSRQPGHVKSWVRSSRGVHRHARLFTPKVTEPKFWSRAFASVIELRATASTDARCSVTGRVQSCATAKAKIDWNQSAKLEENPGKSKVLSAL